MAHPDLHTGSGRFQCAPMPVLTPTASDRLSLLRFPLIVGVVFIHAYATTVQTAGAQIGSSQLHPAAALFIEMLSQGVARSAVPCFFLVAGLLYFWGLPAGVSPHAPKWRTRVRTLLLPYLFWNLLSAGLFALAQSLPATRAYFSGAQTPIAELSTLEFLAGLFGVGRAPFSYPFWFIRDLMLLVLAAPLLGLLLRRLGAPLLVALFGAWLLWPGLSMLPSLEALAWFALGAWLGLREREPFPPASWLAGLLLAYAFALPLVVAGPWPQARPWLHQGLVALGVAAALAATAWLVTRPRWRAALLQLAPASFFVYAAHEPLLTVARKLSYRLLQPEHSLLLLTLYLAVPLAVIGVLLLLRAALQRLLPGPLAWVSGGR